MGGSISLSAVYGEGEAKLPCFPVHRHLKIDPQPIHRHMFSCQPFLLCRCEGLVRNESVVGQEGGSFASLPDANNAFISQPFTDTRSRADKSTYERSTLMSCQPYVLLATG